MARPIVAIRLFVAAILVIGGAGCGGSGTSQVASVPSSPAAATAAATTVAAVAATLTPDPPPSPFGEPPAASLAPEGGDPVTGSLGSFTWGGGGSDSPWLPGAPISVGSGEQLTVTLSDGVPVNDWAAKRVAAGTTDGSGAIAIGDGAAPPITFTAPAAGAWSVQLVVTFGDDLGSAAYYWAVTVR